MADEVDAFRQSSRSNVVLKCNKCKKKLSNGVYCDICEAGYHYNCALPEISMEDAKINDLAWVCARCIEAPNNGHSKLTSGTAIFPKPGEARNVEEELAMLKRENAILLRLVHSLEEENSLKSEKITLLQKVVRDQIGQHDKEIEKISVPELNESNQATAKKLHANSKKNARELTASKQTHCTSRSSPNSQPTSLPVSEQLAAHDETVKLGQQVVIRPAEPAINQFSPSTAKTGSSGKLNEKRQQSRIEATQNSSHQQSSIASENDGFQVVTYKHKQRNLQRQVKRAPIIGTAVAEAGSLLAASKKVWLHVYRLHKDTTTDNVRSFIKSKITEMDIVCEQLTSRGDYSSFKIGADSRHLSTLNDPSFWPSGTAVRRFFLTPRRCPDTT
jgi:hypothetical protein